MNMKTILASVALAAFLAMPPVADAQTTFGQIPIHPIQGCAIPKLDGDKVPFPLKSANSKFELAENETYLLNGYIIQQEGKPYFKLDFTTQPWLATYNRSQFPYFPIDAENPSLLNSSMTDLVQMAVVVRRNQVSGEGHEWSQNLRLDVIIPPVMVTHIRSKRKI